MDDFEREGLLVVAYAYDTLPSAGAFDNEGETSDREPFAARGRRARTKSVSPCAQDPFGRVIREFQKFEVLFDPDDEERDLADGDSFPVRQRVVPESAIGFTHNLVVLGQRRLPDYLFTDMTLVDASGSVVQEFEYHKEGYVDRCSPSGKRDAFVAVSDWEQCHHVGEPMRPKILYDIDVEDEEFTGYVRMITKSSYYIDLSDELMKAIALGVTEYSHFSFYYMLAKNPQHDVYLRFGFLGTLLTFLLFRCIVAVVAAHREWKADKTAGPDFISESQWWSPSGELVVRHASFLHRTRVLGGSILFQFLGVRSLVKDLPIWLHPYKAVQPFAAFKADRARGYLLGFPDEFLFRVEDKPGMLTMYALIAATTIALTFAKLFFYVLSDYSSDISTTRFKNLFFLAMNFLPGAFVTYSNFLGFWRLRMDRKRGYAWLKKKWQDGDAGQKKVMQKIKEKHFGNKGQLGDDFVDHSAANDSKPPHETNADGDKMMKKKQCAELLRQLQLWDVTSLLSDELAEQHDEQNGEEERVSRREAERVLRALRRAAEKGHESDLYCRRGPKIPH